MYYWVANTMFAISFMLAAWSFVSLLEYLSKKYERPGRYLSVMFIILLMFGLTMYVVHIMRVKWGW